MSENCGAVYLGTVNQRGELTAAPSSMLATIGISHKDELRLGGSSPSTTARPMWSKHFTRLTEEFPFLVTKLSPYYDR